MMIQNLLMTSNFIRPNLKEMERNKIGFFVFDLIRSIFTGKVKISQSKLTTKYCIHMWLRQIQ